MDTVPWGLAKILGPHLRSTELESAFLMRSIGNCVHTLMPKNYLHTSAKTGREDLIPMEISLINLVL